MKLFDKILNKNEDQEESASKRRRKSKSQTIEVREYEYVVNQRDLTSQKYVHNMSPEELEENFDTSLNMGLQKKEANKRWHRDGPNIFPFYESTPSFPVIFCTSFFGWYQCIIYAVGVAALVVYKLEPLVLYEFERTKNHLHLGSACIVTAVVIGFLSFTNKTITYFKQKFLLEDIPRDAKVLRDDHFKIIPIESVVVGDIVEMQAGEIVPADVVILRANSFKVEMSIITGDTVPQIRNTESSSPNILKTTNVAFFGSEVVEGNARGMVFATGEYTVIGKILKHTSNINKYKSPLVHAACRYAFLMILVSCLIAVLFYIAVKATHSHWVTAAFYSGAMFMVNMPEVVLLVLSIGVILVISRMASQSFVLKRIYMADTIGTISCLCIDKTGTLTENKLKLEKIGCDLKMENQDTAFVNDYDEVNPLIRAASLCLRAHFVETEGVPMLQREIIGDPTEKVILKYMESRFEASAIRELNKKVFEIPFQSRNKYHVSVHYLPGVKIHVVITKGAPEIIMARCNTMRFQGKNVEFDQDKINTIRKQILERTLAGEKAIAYCDNYLNKNTFPHGCSFTRGDDESQITFPLTGCRFLGFFSFQDPIRPYVARSIGLCRTAGIKIIMITGDHPATAAKVGKRCGILTDESHYELEVKTNLEHDEQDRLGKSIKFRSVIIVGDEIENMRPKELEDMIKLYDEIIFARLTPEQKLKVVKYCQKIGHIVGVVGDGVSDCPALKMSHVGITMGFTGSDAAKTVSDAVILNDDFETIPIAILEGRLLFENVKKCIAYMSSSTMPLMIPYIMHRIYSFPIPLRPIHTVYLNFLIGLWPPISLIYEEPEIDIMSIPPRDIDDEYLVSWNLVHMQYFQIGILQTLAGLVAYILTFNKYGFLFRNIVSKDWNNQAVNDIEDSFGQEWTLEERMYVENEAQTAYFATIMVTQATLLVLCRTRRSSVFQHSMQNWCLFSALIFTLLMTCLMIYIRKLNDVLYTLPLHWSLWIPGVVCAAILFVYDEYRKWIIRTRPYSIIARILYW